MTQTQTQRDKQTNRQTDRLKQRLRGGKGGWWECRICIHTKELTVLWNSTLLATERCLEGFVSDHLLKR